MRARLSKISITNKHWTVSKLALPLKHDENSFSVDLLTRLNIVATVYWLFSSNRTPALGCDGYDRFPESDYIVAMKRGHAYKIPLKDHNGQTIAYDKLKSIFEAIIQQTPEETNWTSLLTTANRDEWAKVSMHSFFIFLS